VHAAHHLHLHHLQRGGVDPVGGLAQAAAGLAAVALQQRHLPRRRCRLGDPFAGEQAVECGIANAVLPAGEVTAQARRVAERFNQLPPGAVRDAKRLMRAPQRELVLQTIKTEGEIFGQRLRSPEARKAFQAFFEKRRPDFSRFS
jgi:enoyl-CoA hydratase/carnithine racemase